MSSDALSSYVAPDADRIPRHLQDRSPFKLPNTEMIFRHPRDQVVSEEDGRVMMAGAVEFQTQVRPGVLTDVCEPKEIYSPEMKDTGRFRVVYDSEIQRGVKETKSGEFKEFLRENQINSMMEDIRKNRFECPQLMWNLRAKDTLWVYVEQDHELLIYQGVATRPDTNHRHHAVIRMHRKYLEWMRTTGSDRMEEYNPDRAYGLVIYTDDFEGEAHRFYVYNFLGWRVPTSTAHYIESKTHSPHAHTKLAREIMEGCGLLGTQNVEILSNHLSKNSAKMVTFGTLVQSLKGAFPAVPDDEDERLALGQYVIEFIAELGRIRPKEIALLGVQKRQEVRNTSVADQATFWHGYLKIAAWLREEGVDEGVEDWRDRLETIAAPFTYEREGKKPYTGDLLSRSNPVWVDRGVLAPNKSGSMRIVNNRQSREVSFEVLRDVLAAADRVRATA